MHLTREETQIPKGCSHFLAHPVDRSIRRFWKQLHNGCVLVFYGPPVQVMVINWK